MRAASAPRPAATVRPIAARANGRYSRAISLQLLAPAAFLGLTYVGTVAGASVYPYPLADAARASQAIVVVGPIVALSAAFEMRIVRHLWGRLDVHRSWYAVVFARLWLVVATGLAAMGVAYAAAGGTGLVLTSGGLEYVLVTLASVVAWTAVGAALGLVFRPVASLPLALVVPYMAIVLPGAWSPLWLRHLNGMLFDCCSTSAVLDTRALVASVAVLCAVALVALATIYVRLGPLRPSWSRPAACAVVSVGLVALGVGQARQLGAAPASARSATELACGGDVCLWPEDRAARRANEVAWPRVRTAWSSLGLEPAATRIGPVAQAGVLDLVVLTSDPRGAAESMAIGLPRAAFDCRDRYDDERINQAANGLTYLVLRKLGLPVDARASALPPGAPPIPSDASSLVATMARC